jgi:hypothetical protein
MLAWLPLAGELLWCSLGEQRSIVKEITSLPLSAWLDVVLAIVEGVLMVKGV